MTPRNLVSLTRLIISPFRVSNLVPSLGTLSFLLGDGFLEFMISYNMFCL